MPAHKETKFVPGVVHHKRRRDYTVNQLRANRKTQYPEPGTVRISEYLVFTAWLPRLRSGYDLTYRGSPWHESLVLRFTPQKKRFTDTIIRAAIPRKYQQ